MNFIFSLELLIQKQSGHGSSPYRRLMVRRYLHVGASGDTLLTATSVWAAGSVYPAEIAAPPADAWEKEAFDNNQGGHDAAVYLLFLVLD